MRLAERKMLVGHASRAVAPASGCLVLFGLPFVAVGLGVIGLPLGVFGDRSAEIHAANWVLYAFGGVFAAAGLLVIVRTIGAKARFARLRRRLQSDPAQPWLGDYPWDPQGDAYRVGGKTAGSLLGLLFFSLFLAPFNAFFFPFIPILIFDAIALVAWGFFFYYVVQSGKYGDSRLRYASFPFFLGEHAEVYLEGIDRLKGLRQLTATLRCVEEVVVPTTSGNSRSSQPTCSSIYEEVRTLRPEEIPFGSGAPARFLRLARQEDGFAALRLEFALPDDDAYETRLAATPPRYWELEVKADTPGVDYDATFLLPVYLRPGAARMSGTLG